MLANQRSGFRIPRGTAFLNCAYMSPVAKSVEAAGIAAVKRKRNPALITPADFFREVDILRVEFSKLIHNTEPGRIVTIPSVSYGMATAASNIRLERGNTVVVAGGQFPSNYYPWAKRCEETGAKIVAVAPPDTLEHRGKEWNVRLLEAIDRTTKVVAIGNVHWADGTRFDLEAIRARTRDVGAALVIDGTQSVGALPFDVNKIKPDALVCAGYKWLLGPYSLGVAYYGEMFDNGIPVEESWMNRLHSEDFRSLGYQSQYKAGAARFEVGEQANFIHVPMLIESLRLLNNWKPRNIQDYCKNISAAPIKRLKSAGLWVEDEKYRGHHLFGIRFPKPVDLAAVASVFAKEKVYVSLRGDSIRVAPHVYNNEKELDKMVDLILSR